MKHGGNKISANTPIMTLSLSFQMLVATFLGILTGLFFGNYCEIFSPWATAYVMLLKITTLPYLIAAIMHGVGQLSIGQGKEILKKGTFFIGLAWTINIGIIYLSRALFPVNKGINYASYSLVHPPTLNFAELLIPENIFNALSSNIVPAIVIFSLLIGIAMMHLKEKQTTMSLLENLVASLTRITRWISRITPLGTFIIIANQVGTIELSTVKEISTYLILYILTICTVVFWIFPRIVSMLTTISATKWIKDLFPILLLAYTTNVVIVCLPFIMQLVEKEVLFLYPKDEKAKSQIQGTVSVLFNLPLGSLFIAFFVLFSAAFYHFPISIPGQVQLFLTTFLTGLGSIGLGAWLNSLSFLIDSLGLPAETIDLFLTTVP